MAAASPAASAVRPTTPRRMVCAGESARRSSAALSKRRPSPSLHGSLSAPRARPASATVAASRRSGAKRMMAPPQAAHRSRARAARK
eukprot:4261184-Prymnesium_polylepis.1